MAKKKPVKPRAEKYEVKVAVKGTFEDIVKASFLGEPKTKNKKSAKGE